MYEVSVEISFRASHQLTLAAGEPEPVHEHQWRVRLQLEGEKLDSDGLLVDFVKAKKLLTQIADELEGKELNKVADLADKNPSAENVARYFYQRLAGQFDAGAHPTAVSVQEAPGCWACYRP